MISFICNAKSSDLSCLYHSLDYIWHIIVFLNLNTDAFDLDIQHALSYIFIHPSWIISGPRQENQSSDIMDRLTCVMYLCCEIFYVISCCVSHFVTLCVTLCHIMWHTMSCDATHLSYIIANKKGVFNKFSTRIYDIYLMQDIGKSKLEKL